MLTIDLERVSLRPLAIDDEALFCRLYTDPEIMRHIGKPIEPADARSAMHRSIQLNSESVPRRRFLIIHARDAEADAGMLALTFAGGGIEIGVMLLPAFHGRGIATEMVLALIDHLFSSTDTAFLCTRTDMENALATSVMHKLGFTKTTPGEGERAFYWELRREDWLERVAAGPRRSP